VVTTRINEWISSLSHRTTVTSRCTHWLPHRASDPAALMTNCVLVHVSEREMNPHGFAEHDREVVDRLR
jgi:hypothetical protein